MIHVIIIIFFCNRINNNSLILSINLFVIAFPQWYQKCLLRFLWNRKKNKVRTWHMMVIFLRSLLAWASQVVLVVKNPSASAGTRKRCGSNPWVRKIPWRKAQQPTPYSCLENPMNKRAWWATVQGVTKRLTWLKPLSMRC